MQSAAPSAKVLTFSEARREKREHEFRQELRAKGIHTRELVLLQREAQMENSAYWHRRWQTAHYINERMMIFLSLANERFAASELLLGMAEAEVERLKALIK